MMDSIIHDLFQFRKSRHAEAENITDMPLLAQRLGYTFKRHEYSFYDPVTKTVYVRYDATPQEARADAAHELMHAVTMEGLPSYDEVLRYYHASVPNMEAHTEIIADHGADQFLMPDELVGEIVRECGYSARAIWELSRFADVSLRTALRRFVHFRPDSRVAAFLSCGGYIMEADSLNFWLPFWKGDRVPEPHLLLENGFSTYRLPRAARRMLGVITVDDFDAA